MTSRFQGFPAAQSGSQPDWLLVALEEYKALRAEILAALGAQYTTLSFGTAAVGVLVGFGFQAWDERFIAEIAFLGAVPLVAYLVLVIWMGELMRMHRAGDYLAELEPRINARVGRGQSGDAFGWETFLRKPGEKEKTQVHYWNYRAIIVMYQVLAVAAIAIGAYRRGASPVTVLIVTGEAFALAAVTAFLYWQWCARLRVEGLVSSAFCWCCQLVGLAPLRETREPVTRCGQFH